MRIINRSSLLGVCLIAGAVLDASAPASTQSPPPGARVFFLSSARPLGFKDVAALVNRQKRAGDTSDLVGFIDMRDRQNPRLVAPLTASSGLTRIELQPSVLSGRPQQATIGTRFFDHHYICGFCDSPASCNAGDGEFYPFDITLSLEEKSGGFGGHNETTHMARPVGQIVYKGTAVGHFAPPASGQANPRPVLTTMVTAADQENSLDFRINLPEASQEVVLIATGTCRIPGYPPLTLDDGYYLQVKAVDEELRRLPNATNAPGARFVVERTGNSHGQEAGYANAKVRNKIDTMLSTYGTCGVAPPVGELHTLRSEGVSLHYGGLYDITPFDTGPYNWKSPHANHRYGADLDISSSTLGRLGRRQERLRCLFDAITAAGFRIPVSNEALVEDPATGAVSFTGDHVHLWTGQTNIYPIDQTPAYEFCVTTRSC